MARFAVRVLYQALADYSGSRLTPSESSLNINRKIFNIGENVPDQRTLTGKRRRKGLETCWVFITIKPEELNKT